MAIDDCKRCADWWRLGLSATCPTCDLIELENESRENATEAHTAEERLKTRRQRKSSKHHHKALISILRGI